MSTEIKGDFLMKRHKYKGKRFSGTTLLRNDLELIRKLAQENEVPVYQMAHTIIQEWAGWKEPELAENPIDITQEV
jgi:hypothetical protein